MAIDVVVGSQRGDEGKGRFVDMLAEEYDIVARFNGGNNAGHTVVLPNDEVLKLHLVPSGIAHESCLNVIGNGTLVDIPKLADEIDTIREKGIEFEPERLMLSSAAHLILPHHIFADMIREKSSVAQGSTKNGIAPSASAKAMREGARVEMAVEDPSGLYDLILDALRKQARARLKAGIEPINMREAAKEYIDAAQKVAQFAMQDTVLVMNRALADGKRVLAEGAQAYLLDIDHGMYPYTTSTSTTAGGVATGLGVPPQSVNKVLGVVKAVQSHVGGGPFVTEVHDEERLAALYGDMTTIDAEVGTTTGRTRRLGALDLAQIRRANMVNGAKETALTKLDWVTRFGDEVPVCISYEIDGEVHTVAPDSAYKLERSRPIYASLPTWPEDIQDVRNFSDLPPESRHYIRFVEAQLNTSITMIGVGPRRDQVIDRRTA
jgi:adenylosuccinate synthase